jgi:hypothetical protein
VMPWKASAWPAFSHPIVADPPLLMTDDMTMHFRCLTANAAKLHAKGVESVHSQILNLCNLRPTLIHDKVCNALILAFVRSYGNCRIDSLQSDSMRSNGLLVSLLYNSNFQTFATLSSQFLKKNNKEHYLLTAFQLYSKSNWNKLFDTKVSIAKLHNSKPVLTYCLMFHTGRRLPKSCSLHITSITCGNNQYQQTLPSMMLFLKHVFIVLPPVHYLHWNLPIWSGVFVSARSEFRPLLAYLRAFHRPITAWSLLFRIWDGWQ